jgi:hypothetical protein
MTKMLGSADAVRRYCSEAVLLLERSRATQGYVRMAHEKE